ncbi:TPA: citrate lyase subunit alpha [Serratia marcescens]|nr:citrate lyase subunit alpha [Serratia marcescens]
MRKIPDYIKGYGDVIHYSPREIKKSNAFQEAKNTRRISTGESKQLPDIDAIFDTCDIRDGSVISFQHHLRNGDYVLNKVMEVAAARNLRGLTLVASSLFPVHQPLVSHIKNGVVTKIYTSYMAGPVADAISHGALENPVILQTHGGRARAIENEEIVIDVAFIAAPTADFYGNLNGIQGPAACGSLGYAEVDAQWAHKVAAITDNLVPYPAFPAQITQDKVDYVVVIDQIGTASQIVSGTTRVTEDPVGLRIAQDATAIITASGLLRDGFSFQAGAGSVSLAVAKSLHRVMESKGVQGSFASGGITKTIVDMLDSGLFRALFDVQCFDLDAVDSYRRSANHYSMSASLYANPGSKGAIVDNLDVMVLGASEVDVNFNVNVTTRSDGVIMGGSGGHADTAAGAKLAIVTTKLTASGKYPKVVENVNNITTPGETIDVVVTDYGIAVNPRNKELISKLESAGLKLTTIQELQRLAAEQAGVKITEHSHQDRIVAIQEYRDGSVIDVIYQI